MYCVSIILLLTSACEKDTELKLRSGQLFGNVSLINESQLAQNKSGVEIRIEGSEPELKTTTDESGQFTISNLVSGTYNVIFNKEGFCEHKIIGYQFIGGNKPASLGNIDIYLKPTFQITNLEISQANVESTEINLLIKANVSDFNTNSYAYFRYYLSNNENVSFSNYISTGFKPLNPITEELEINIQTNTLKFPIGSELYMIIYPTTESNQYYIDIQTGNYIYSTVNSEKPSNVAKTAVPNVNPN
jgi:hypothetical protein